MKSLYFVPRGACLLSSALVAVVLWVSPAAAQDVLLADFEGADYGDWKTEGEAFGSAPARGTLPSQMSVSGFLGEGLVNSFLGGDGAVGVLTSPPFELERRYLCFLIGGGMHPGKTCIDLLIDGEVVRTATGPNDRPGGSERLDWHSWDVSELHGRTAILRIVDQERGGWGHLNVDQILLSDRERRVGPVQRELIVDGAYLHLPVKNGATRRKLRLEAAGETVGEFDIELAEGEPDFWVFREVSALRGESLVVHVDRLPSDSPALEAIRLADSPPGADQFYREEHRPQFHFTSRRGWLNDPNGLVYSDGEWHLFYQHNPYGWSWGNMHWGHAVSEDLFHWKELPTALFPQRYGDWCFSGSGFVDRENTSGFREGDGDLVVAAYTSTGRGESIAYSNDRGRTFSDYAGNPVVEHRGRDPKVIWHEPTKRWVMAVYDEEGERGISFHSSADLKEWTLHSKLDGFYECPDLFELSVDGRGEETKWVLYGADGKYVIGEFDGRTFTPEPGKHQLWYGDFYAAQTFSDAPDGRRIQIGWGRGVTFPGMPFNQQMTVPVELRLQTTEDGVRLFAEPVAELSGLRRATSRREGLELRPDAPLRQELESDLLELELRFELGDAEALEVVICGVRVSYDAAGQVLACHDHEAPLVRRDGPMQLQILVDRGSFEVFGNDGRVALSCGVIPDGQNRSLEISARGGAVRLHELEVIELASVWSVPREREPEPRATPNIILCMTDDQGWGDVGYHDHPVLQTPNLDAMAASGLRFDRFYSGAPVCSPTRASALTGRHPYRIGVTGANQGHMLARELTLAELLRSRGYATGHFGKWHLGTLTTEVRDSNRGGKPKEAKHYAPPWDHGFEVCFSTEAKVPTWDPMLDPKTGEAYGTYYWNEEGQRVTENLEGDDSRVIMDRVLPFLREACLEGKPFFTVIWFHTPHLPVVAGPEYLARYAEVESEEQREYYACLTAMDEQVGRLRRELRTLGVAENTMLWFCSDNGPETTKVSPGSAGPFRGRKRSLHEGGVRVPASLEWPAGIPEPRIVRMPCSTSDYLPTVLELLGIEGLPAHPLSGTEGAELDGISLLPVIRGELSERPTPIGFQYAKALALTGNRYKVISKDRGQTFALYDLIADPGEEDDLAGEQPEVLAEMVETLEIWRESCRVP